MKESYQQMSDRHAEEFNAFPMAFAFSNAQFKEAMEKFGLTVEDTDKVVNIAGGGIILKSEKEKYTGMVVRQNAEHKTAMQDAEFAFQAFSYELSNHEYSYTYDEHDTLMALGLTAALVEANPVLKEALAKAKMVQ